METQLMGVRKREWFLAMIAVVCVGAFLGDRLVVKPLRTLWKERSTRIVKLRSNLERAALLIEREDTLRGEWQKMVEASLPADESATEERVLEAMSRWVETSGLGAPSLKPRWSKSEDKTYKTIGCRAQVEGTLSAFSRFLFELERDTLPVRVEEVEISSRDDSGRRLTLAVRFTGLVLPEDTQ
jgi:hypothetical protein